MAVDVPELEANVAVLDMGQISSGKCRDIASAFRLSVLNGMIRGAAPDHILQVACEAGAAAVQGRGALVDLSDDLRRAFA